MRVMRTYGPGWFDTDELVASKRGRQVSVCLPARDEQDTVGPIVEAVRRHLSGRRALVDEILVVDDGSSDSTAAAARAAGARVVPVSGTTPRPSPAAGKGEAMWKALSAATGDLLVFCDADVRHFDPHFVVGLLGPLLTTEEVGFVKGFYRRPVDGGAAEGGRVTELVARPLLALLFPGLAGVAQPLAGECAARREVLEQVPFVGGYGVDIGLLIDVASRFGLGSMAQCDLGARVHRNRPLAELAPQAADVLRTALSRAGAGGPPVEVRQRPPLASLAR